MKSQWEERMKQQGLAVKAWWEQNEKDESAKLTRGELKAVVEFIEPKAKAAMADDETMDELVMQCEHGLARQTEVVRVMAKARSYLADASYFEGLYRRHDADGNGHLSKSEMLPLVRSVCVAHAHDHTLLTLLRAFLPLVRAQLREVASQLPNPPNAPVGEVRARAATQRGLLVYIFMWLA